MKVVNVTEKIASLKLVYDEVIQTLINNNLVRPSKCITNVNVSTPDEEEVIIKTFQSVDNPSATDWLKDHEHRYMLIIEHLNEYLAQEYGESIWDILEPSAQETEHIILYTDKESLEVHQNDTTYTFIYHFTGQFD